MSAHLPLRDLVGEAAASPLDVALAAARQASDEQQDANAHDHHAMTTAAVSLQIKLRNLIASLDAERGMS